MTTDGKAGEEKEELTPKQKVSVLKGMFPAIVFFALAVQILITVVWNVTGRPTLGVATPILAFMVLAVGVLAFTLGVLTNPQVRHPADKEIEAPDPTPAAES